MINGARPRHIVFIAFHYPPDPEVGSVRVGGLVDSLLQWGHRVEVITGRLPSEAAGIREERDRLTVHAVSWARNPRHALAWLLRFLSPGTQSGQGPESDPPEDSPPSTGRLRRAVISTLYLPDDFQGFILAASNKAASLIRYGGADLCYTSTPPFSTALAGLLVNVFTGVPWILEFRDPWTDIERYGSEFRPAPLRKWERWLESRCLARAKGLVAVTPSFGNRLRQRLGEPEARKVIVALNGIPDFADPVPRAPGDPITILHAGTLYGPRNPRPFLAIIARLRQRNPAGMPPLRIEFLGTAPDPALDRMIEQFGLQDVARCLPPIPRQEAKARMARADLLLLLGASWSMQVPQKTFEYLGAGKAILAFLDRDGDTWRLLQQVGGHHLIDDTDTEHGLTVVEGAIAEAARASDATLRPLNEGVRRLATAHQFSAIKELILGLT